MLFFGEGNARAKSKEYFYITMRAPPQSTASFGTAKAFLPLFPSHGRPPPNNQHREIVPTDTKHKTQSGDGATTQLPLFRATVSNFRRPEREHKYMAGMNIGQCMKMATYAAIRAYKHTRSSKLSTA
jgi:hypothetical protein